ncbi:hypothetical protein LRR18_12105 [Mangrovimonas sp. AS39]|uniref:hypothetical protein n=1 Tax=Mangrovimonas futianensis TaxID=2895523 RepID=UPI001E58CD8A|nr:hypothetical protein [Mangrovimonas futianensis]MCF1192329.1 hypothetical protein [Mangrovimonas futianensis]MCF1195922.1 hypothetical protein [Mangrovimonas futianensis]MCF1423225.1 hypothetical protein [Mangrovimonas futianensis]
MSQETQYYTCKYCFESFIPKRRRVQKYCSNTCRNKAHHARKTATTTKETLPTQIENKPAISNPTKESINASGVANAAIGTFTVNTLSNLFTKEENKPATKKDLVEILKALKGRYHIIKNGEPLGDGRKPYYDIVKQELVYLWPFQTTTN